MHFMGSFDLDFLNYKIMMSRISKRFCGLILLTVPTIQYGGFFLLQVISGHVNELELTAFQQAMFRAGHAHAGVLIILALIAQFLVDQAKLSKPWAWVARVGFPLSAVFVSGGFFISVIGEQLRQPNGFIFVLYIGIGLLAISLVILGIGLLRSAQDH